MKAKEAELAAALSELAASGAALAASEAARRSEAAETHEAVNVPCSSGETLEMTLEMALDPEEAERPCFGRYLLVWEEHLMTVSEALPQRCRAECAWRMPRAQHTTHAHAR